LPAHHWQYSLALLRLFSLRSTSLPVIGNPDLTAPRAPNCHSQPRSHKCWVSLAPCPRACWVSRCRRSQVHPV
jgi:hypothetical protein